MIHFSCSAWGSSVVPATSINSTGASVMWSGLWYCRRCVNVDWLVCYSISPLSHIIPYFPQVGSSIGFFSELCRYSPHPVNRPVKTFKPGGMIPGGLTVIHQVLSPRKECQLFWSQLFPQQVQPSSQVNIVKVSSNIYLSNIVNKYKLSSYILYIYISS